uniref:Uncharacterized protein n=1 Tax=Sciurus vulgaris TaxID=55149 RepID=A0A8D2DLB0_SCIVU
LMSPFEGLDEGPNFLSEEDRGAINVDLQSDAALQVDISDALSERDKVKFTVHTKRYIIPPAPPRPDFDASGENLQKLVEGEGSMTKEEFTKMKQELEAEYLAIFKKTPKVRSFFFF